MIFNEGYYTPMDREYGVIHTPTSNPEENIRVPLQIEPKGSKISIPPEDLGIGVLQLSAGADTLRTRIWGGASKVELGFSGRGKGNAQNLTPGSFSKEDREAIRDLARINKVETSTHASVGINGLAGYDSRGEFSESHRKDTLDEVRRAIDFAADATSGGAVVVHTGEFPRPIVKTEQNGSGVAKFAGHSQEAERAEAFLVNSHTGQLMRGVREDEVVWRPVYEYDVQKDGTMKRRYLKNPDGSIMEDEFIKEYNKNQGATFDARVPVIRTENGNVLTKPVKFKEFRNEKRMDAEFLKKYNVSPSDVKNIDKYAALEFFKEQQSSQIQGQLQQVRQYENYYEEGKKKRDKYIETIQAYEQVMKHTPDKNKWKHLIPMESRDIVPGDVEDPLIFLRQRLQDIDRQMYLGSESAVSGRARANQLMDTIGYIQPVEDFAQKKTSESIAEAAIYAIRREEQENRERTKLGIEKLRPIFVSPENLFPEQYGSHPTETATMIREARQELRKRLWDYDQNKPRIAGVSSAEEANRLADQHIKGTIDVGHLNMWRKYWQDDINKSPEQNDKSFNEWAVNNLKGMVKEGLIGNIHMHDNFGFHDEHVEVGQGNAPIHDFMKVLKEGGLGKDIVIEINGQNLNTALPRAWAEFGSPIYASGYQIPRGEPQKFEQIRSTYAGHAQGPHYLVGDATPVPNSEDWRLWSQTSLE